MRICIRTSSCDFWELNYVKFIQQKNDIFVERVLQTLISVGTKNYNEKEKKLNKWSLPINKILNTYSQWNLDTSLLKLILPSLLTAFVRWNFYLSAVLLLPVKVVELEKNYTGSNS